MSNKMNANINFFLERVEGKRLIFSGFFTEFPFDGVWRFQNVTSIELFCKNVVIYLRLFLSDSKISHSD